MIPDKLDFLNKFDRFYQALVNDVKEDKYDEQDFYLIITAKVKAMDKSRREKRRFVK